MDWKEFNDFVSLRCLHVHPFQARPVRSPVYLDEKIALFTAGDRGICDEDKNIITR